MKESTIETNWKEFNLFEIDQKFRRIQSGFYDYLSLSLLYRNRKDITCVIVIYDNDFYDSRHFLCKNDLYDKEGRVKVFFDDDVDDYCEQMDVNASFWDEKKLWINEFEGEKWVMINRWENRTEGPTVTNTRNVSKNC